MAYPDLYNDESKILVAQNVKVKSVTFEAILTTRRLILVDSKKQMVPPQEILLATVKNVDSGENAIRDPTITLSIITNTGTTRQMILTFSSKSSTSGERKRECEEWIKTLRQHLSQTIEHPVLPDIPTLEEEVPSPVPEPATPATHLPRISIVNTPPQKKRIEISRPIKKIIESEPAMPAPIETTSLPVGSFCNRCGSRVPPESGFCNRCGTPVVTDGELEAALAQPVSTPLPAAEPAHVPQAPESAPVVPQATVPPTFRELAAQQEPPIEEVIHSIEPLIADSVPRKHDRSAVLKPRPAKAPETAGAEQGLPVAEGDVQWPVITPPSETPESPPVVPETPPPSPPAPPVPERPSGKGKVIAIAVLAVVILAVIAGVFLFANPLGNGSTPEVTPAPTVATAATTVAVTTTIPVTTTVAPETTVITTPAGPVYAIPSTGVWIRITYANEFTGSVGTAGAADTVTNSGEQVYRISTNTGTVVANIQKVDGSGDLLTVELYKDGELITMKSTRAPKGIVEIQESLKPAATPTPEPTTIMTTIAPVETTIVEGNTTANQTVSE